MGLVQRDAAELKAREFESKYLEALAREAELQEKLRVALEASVENAGKLITLQEKHARELKELRRKLEKARCGARPRQEEPKSSTLRGR